MTDDPVDRLTDMMVARAQLFELDRAPIRDRDQLLYEAGSLILSLVATLESPTPEAIEEHRDMAILLTAHITRVKWQARGKPL